MSKVNNINDLALMEVDWALQESYKRAVKLRGITDWSCATTDSHTLVEQYQLKITELILKSLWKKQ